MTARADLEANPNRVFRGLRHLVLPRVQKTLHRRPDFYRPSCHNRFDPSSLCHERRDDRGADERETAMSFLFALLQLASFASIDSEDPVFVARDHRAQGIEAAAPTRSDLLQRPIVTPCAGNSCR